MARIKIQAKLHINLILFTELPFFFFKRFPGWTLLQEEHKRQRMSSKKMVNIWTSFIKTFINLSVCLFIQSIPLFFKKRLYSDIVIKASIHSDKNRTSLPRLQQRLNHNHGKKMK